MRTGALLSSLWIAAFVANANAVDKKSPLKVGSKAFTESVVLGELITRLAEDGGSPTVHRRELGGTQVLFKALKVGEIDIYPEYVGTIREEIYSGENLGDAAAMKRRLAADGIGISRPLGFENTYALGMLERVARQLSIVTISDLTRNPDLTFAFSNEFMRRGDGWPALREHYQLPQQATGMDHDLAYRGLASGAVDLMELYSTDAEIDYYGLRILDDDKGFFPDYQAVLLYRLELADERPDAFGSILRLEDSIDAELMARMNKRAKIDGVEESVVAADYLAQRYEINAAIQSTGLWRRLAVTTVDHLTLTAASLSLAIFFAIPIGIAAATLRPFAQFILGAAGILQTIPSLAMFVFMIPLLGIGPRPAIAALFLYSLLPIVRNTYAGLHDIPQPLRESAEALGLGFWAKLRQIELPIASRSIFAGIKTAAVINVGTATLGALIGAGGYGQPILTGIRLDDTRLILEGAIPAAALALLVQGVFEISERFLVPRGLRLRSATQQ